MTSPNVSRDTVQLLDAAAVAELLIISTRSAENMMTRRELPVVKLGSRNRVRLADLHAYIDERTRPAVNGGAR